MILDTFNLGLQLEFLYSQLAKVSSQLAFFYSQLANVYLQLASLYSQLNKKKPSHVKGGCIKKIINNSVGPLINKCM